MSVGIAPISEHIGAAVTGLDLNTVTNSVTVQLREALATSVVLVFRGQQFEPPDLLKAVRVFGEPERQNYSQFNHPDFPDIGILDYEGEQTPADMCTLILQTANARQSRLYCMRLRCRTAVAIPVLPTCVPSMPLCLKRPGDNLMP